MKKIKIMLLSLALLAIVGGTLAFKAKFHTTWCTTNAYSDFAGPGGTVRYYCSFMDPFFGTTITTCSPTPVNHITSDPAPGAILKICTTMVDEGLIPCDKVCDIQTSTKGDGDQ